MERDAEDFERFVLDTEPRLRRALVARYGRDQGREATAAALAWAWEHRSELPRLANPIGYLYRVGQSASRRRRFPFVIDRPRDDQRLVEPALEAALSRLPDRQRVVLLLVDGAGWTQAEVAELLIIGRSTVQQHLERARRRIRCELKVKDGDD